MVNVILPLHVDIPRARKNKRVFANMNGYKNFPHRLNTAVKDEYKRIIWEQLSDVREELNSPIQVTFNLYVNDKERCDLANICPVIEKYIDDAIVEYGLLRDDNVKYLKRIVYEFKGVDKSFPRCEVTYESMNPKK